MGRALRMCHWDSKKAFPKGDKMAERLNEYNNPEVFTVDYNLKMKACCLREKWKFVSIYKIGINIQKLYMIYKIKQM